MKLITATEAIAFSFFLEGRIIHFLEYLYAGRLHLPFDQSYIDVFLSYLDNALIFDGLRMCAVKNIDMRQVHLSMVISKLHHYTESNDDLWFALTSGIFLPKASRDCPTFLGEDVREWWTENPCPTLADLLSEWESCGGVNGTDKVDMTEQAITDLIGFLDALEMHLVGTARDIAELLSPVEVKLSHFQDLLHDMSAVAAA